MSFVIAFFFTFADDHAVGLSTFTIMAGLGGSMGYVMGAIDWGWLGETMVVEQMKSCVFSRLIWYSWGDGKTLGRVQKRRIIFLPSIHLYMYVLQ